MIEDILSSLQGYGFKRILLVNGHGGNSPVSAFATQWTAKNPDLTVKLHNWWNAPKTLATVKAIDPVASHASWMENFPWTRLSNVVMPQMQKPLVDFARLDVLKPQGVRDYLREGNFGGDFQKDDETMLKLWQVGVEEDSSRNGRAVVRHDNN